MCKHTHWIVGEPQGWYAPNPQCPFKLLGSVHYSDQQPNSTVMRTFTMAHRRSVWARGSAKPHNRQSTTHLSVQATLKEKRSPNEYFDVAFHGSLAANAGGTR